MQVLCSTQTHYRFRTNTSDKPPTNNTNNTTDTSNTTTFSHVSNPPTITQQDIKRFEKAVKRNDIKYIEYTLQAGMRPTTNMMCLITQTCHTRIVEMCIDVMEHIDVKVLKLAMKRRYEPLFCNIVPKVKHIHGSIIDMFVEYKPIFLFHALQHALDPNTTLKNGDTLIERCYKKQKYQSVYVLLHCKQLKIPAYLMKQLMRHPEYIPLCIQHGATPSLHILLIALRENNTSLLTQIIQGMDKHYQHREAWETIKDLLTCPITQELTTNVNRTPDGHYYDRDAIRKWVEQKQNDPMTRNTLQPYQLEERVKCLATLTQTLQQLIQQLIT